MQISTLEDLSFNGGIGVFAEIDTSYVIVLYPQCK